MTTDDLAVVQPERPAEGDVRDGLAAAQAGVPEGGDVAFASEHPTASNGATTNGRGDDSGHRYESEVGRAYSLVAPHTGELKRLAGAWMDSKKRKQALKQRWSRTEEGARVWGNMAAEKEHEAVVTIYNRWSREVKKALKHHPLWSFLSDLPGLAGPTTAYLIGQIRDPWRFPGQRCDEGHYLRPIFEVGEPCPIEVGLDSQSGADRCGAPCLRPRPGTGVRSLWHYCGLFPGANKQKNQSCSWDPELKGLCLAPDFGLAAQIVRQKPEPYRTTYDDEKARLTRERGYRSDGERVEPVESPHESDASGGDLPPLIRLDRIARTIAVKQFVGDLLMAWKTVQNPEDY